MDDILNQEIIEDTCISSEEPDDKINDVVCVIIEITPKNVAHTDCSSDHDITLTSYVYNTYI